MKTEVFKKNICIATVFTLAILCGGGILMAQPTGAIETTNTKAVKVNLASNLSIAVLEDFDIDIAPTSMPELKTASGVITVSTNNATGYTLTAEVDNTTTNNLVNTVKSEYTISNLESSTTPSSFPVNHWGYSLDEPTSFSSFSPLPAIGSTLTLKTADGPAATSTTNFSIGTKVDTGIASGGYANKIKFTAVTNYVPEPTPTPPEECPTYAPDITYMQDINDTVKGNMTVNQQYFAIDKRDDKGYCIAKLQDGNVWMTQSLDLNLDSSTPLTPEDSDVASSWTPQTTYTDSSQWTSVSQTAINSLDLGDFYYDGSTIDKAHDSGATYSDFNGFLTPGDPNINQHYHVGNLYSWNASTAGTGGTITSAEATGSICPKGWRLPMGGSSSATTNEFKHLIDAYSVGSTVQTLINEPLYLLRGGIVYSGQLRFAAYYSYYWSSTAGGSISSYGLSLGDTNSIDPSYTNNRYYGFSVRCLAR